MFLTRLVMVEVKVVRNRDIMETRARKWSSNLSVNKDQELSEYRVSLAEGKKKKEKN